MADIHSFGTWVRRRRKALDLTQDELATRTGCSKELIAKIEGDARRPSKQVAGLLATALQLELAEQELFVRAARAELAADRLPEPTLSVPHPQLVGSVVIAGGHVPVLRHSHLNVQVPPTALIGRARELADLTALLERNDVRLVSLTGTGGSGKTRLALELAAHFAQNQGVRFHDGICFADLAPVTDQALAVQAICYALGLPDRAGQSQIERLRTLLRDRCMLLVLDNVEQVQGAAGLLSDLLQSCPELALLVTSRALLHLTAEYEYPVEPLGEADAVQLFAERARTVRPKFALNAGNLPSIAAICRRLDALPLAIELAAARIRLFSPETLLARLEHTGALVFLTGGARDLPVRQQTMRATLAWSYDLLGDDEQAFFRCLGAFTGDFSEPAAAAVAGCEPPQTLMLLSSLVEQNLVRVQATDTVEPRFMLLETVREHALEHLHKDDQAAQIERRHATWFAARAHELAEQLWGPRQVEAMAVLHADYSNTVAALTWLCKHDTDSATQVIVKLGWYWYWTVHRQEGVTWLTRALNWHPEPSEQRADLLRMLALLWYDSGVQQALDWMEESLAIARRLGDTRRIAETLRLITQIHASTTQNVELFQQALHECQPFYEDLDETLGRAYCLIFEFEFESWQRSLALFRDAGHLRGIADVQTHLGRALHQQGAGERALHVLEEAITAYRRLGDSGGEMWSILTMGDVAQTMGLFDIAAQCYERGGYLAELLDDRNARAWAALNHGEVLIHQGERSTATPLFRTAIRIFAETRYPFGLRCSLIAAAYIALAQQAPGRAAALLGALDDLTQQEEGAPFDQCAPPEHAWLFTHVRGNVQCELKPEEFERNWSEGSRLSLDEAIRQAVAVTESAYAPW